MTATSATAMGFWTDPHHVENGDGSVTVYSDRTNTTWITFTSREDCALHMQIAAHADSLFIARQASPEMLERVAAKIGEGYAAPLIDVPGTSSGDLEPLPQRVLEDDCAYAPMPHDPITHDDAGCTCECHDDEDADDEKPDGVGWGAE